MDVYACVTSQTNAIFDILFHLYYDLYGAVVCVFI